MKGKFSQTWWSGFTITKIIEPAAYIVKQGKSEYRLNKSHVKLDESQSRKGDVVTPPIVE